MIKNPYDDITAVFCNGGTAFIMGRGKPNVDLKDAYDKVVTRAYYLLTKRFGKHFQLTHGHIHTLCIVNDDYRNAVKKYCNKNALDLKKLEKETNTKLKPISFDQQILPEQ